MLKIFRLTIFSLFFEKSDNKYRIGQFVATVLAGPSSNFTPLSKCAMKGKLDTQ